MARITHLHTDRDAAVKTLENEGLFVIEWTDDAGVHYPEHSHREAEVRWVLEGDMTVSGRRVGPGDRIDLEPGEMHDATVGPHGVRYLAGNQR